MHRGTYIAGCAGLTLAVALVAAFLMQPAAAQPPDRSCGTCHTSEEEGYALSAHAVAATSEAYRTLAGAASSASAWGADGCRRCHMPLAAGITGIPCEGCHLIAGVGTLGYGDFHLATDGAMRGVTPGQAPHPTIASPLFGDSLFCAACHEQYHPESGVALQSTYTEWLNSSASRAGTTCQACHMAEGAPSHAFGAGTAGDAAKGKALAEAIAFDVRWPEQAQAGSPCIFDVLVENKEAGHALPTGKPEGYEMWLEMAATVDGQTVFTEALTYGVVFADSEGRYEPPVTSADAASLFRDHRLFPGRPVAERFVFVVPSDARGQLDVEVRLMYRRTPRWLSERLGLTVAPAVVVHRASASLPLVEPPPRATYVPPTPTATVAPTPTPIVEEGGRLEGEGWLAPFLLVGGLVLLGVAAWALKARAV